MPVHQGCAQASEGYAHNWLPYHVVSAEAGGSAGLPCDIDSELADEPVLVRWFRFTNSSDGAPFYILDDVQRRGIWNANHDISVDFAGRAYFSALSSPASLQLSRLGPADAGRYLCSVSFHSGEVRTHNVSLRVGGMCQLASSQYLVEARFMFQVYSNGDICLMNVVSASVPVLTDGEGSILASTIGPYYIGHNLRINCIVEKGLPTPSIVWKHNGVPIVDANASEGSDDRSSTNKYRVIARPRTEGAHSILNIGRLGRDELRATFSCETSNEISEQPLETAITIDLILPPLTVEVEHGGVSYTAGAQAEFRCRVTGSRPFPVVTWLLATRKLEAFFSHVSDEDDGNTTVSTLLLTMSPVENGQKLICRVINHQLPGSTWEDSVELNIIHPPVVFLRGIGGQDTLDAHVVSQSQDVTLECTITANPPATRVFWTLNDRLLEDNAVMRNSTLSATTTIGKPMRFQTTRLTLRNATASQHNGRYNCDVTNPLGSVRSNDLDLRVRYPPRCHPSVDKVYRYGASSKGSTKTIPTLAIRCHMDADPVDRLRFTWIAYNTSGSREWHVFHPSTYQVLNETTSLLSYRPSSMNEETTIECWANNTVYVNNSTKGPEPCVFHVEQYGVPPTLEGCQVINQAQSWFSLECDSLRELDDKSKEFYVLELYNADNGQLLVNVTSDEPAFQVTDLPDATECIAQVFAVNDKGRSDPSRVIIQAISPPSKLLTSGRHRFTQ
ncbi:hemicentin-2-like [Tropilaelaps mercedesae]|uniref:Hemicentin-2-like n=1 Tax=Tropilaelaps mercedesae TaxID=418985 RepID=A0A1V9XKL7_9ACAR|nr:hemicentin-2-like [Tropilaelaps mercedesae]